LLGAAGAVGTADVVASARVEETTPDVGTGAFCGCGIYEFLDHEEGDD